jgi:16S rRNA (guanine527-N7)-methyltransferase
VQCERLVDYARLLVRWNRVHNLTAIRRGEDILTHHLLDSLALAPELERVGPAGSARVLDVGSGGGLPGLVLAVALPRAQFTLVDAVQKKCAFLVQARLELGLANVEVIHARVEALRAPPFDVIVSRAFASLAPFVALTRHLLKATGCWLAMKGQAPDAELAELSKDVKVIAVVPLAVPGLAQERHLVELRPV